MLEDPLASRRFGPTAQSTYAELIDRLEDAERENLFAHERSFLRRTRKGKRYWYSRRFVSDSGNGDRREERYLGPDNEETRAKVADLKEQAANAKAAAKARRGLVRQLVAAGYPATDRRTGRVIEELARAGVFRLGGTLVGSHAYPLYSGVLGVRLEARQARTQDVDPGVPLSIAVNDKPEPDLKAAIDKAETILDIPPIYPKSSSSRWRTRDRELKVELLTPLVGKPKRGSVLIPSLGVYAEPIRFLDYLLVATVRAPVLTGAGVPARVPSPERYALHKLIVSQKRPGDSGSRTKARKDMAQAAALLEVLLIDAPEDLANAWADLIRRGKKGWEDPARKTLRAAGKALNAQFEKVVAG